MYSLHGLGQIVKIETKFIYGSESQFYTISFDDGKIMLNLSVDKSNENLKTLRFPIEQHEIEEIYKILSSPPDLSKGGVRANKLYHEIIKSGNLASIAKLARDIHKKKLEMKNSSSPTFNQQRLLNLALKLIIDELSEVEAVDKEAIKDKISNMLQVRL